MATIDDIGTPGAPLSDPPLTEWQAAVRDALATITTLSLTPGPGWTGTITVKRTGNLVTLIVDGLTKAAPEAFETIAVVPAGYRPPGAHTLFTLNFYVGVGKSELALATNGLLQTFASPPADFRHYGAVTYITADPTGISR